MKFIGAVTIAILAAVANASPAPAPAPAPAANACAVVGQGCSFVNCCSGYHCMNKNHIMQCVKN
ncbi:hypothetical protein N7533_001237 [Penicillium manginii]|uniref:uncharacterized protein n=1 Tax=Penicillium manginii TaxID=203109 RepID=UPI002549B50D|nr:uncharacterized protein N7533_001237 [Penicillium manginii]KAJ5768654.1 hypothetical protein N7533_001237 [Penicillium manginii]